MRKYSLILILFVFVQSRCDDRKLFESEVKYEKYPVSLNQLESLVRSDAQNSWTRGIDGGVSWAACSVLLGMAEQLGDINNVTIVTGLEILCSYLPELYEEKCSLFLHIFGPVALRLIDLGVSPDKICYASGLCYDEHGSGMCHLFPVSEDQHDEQHPLINISETEKKLVSFMILESLPWICWIPGVKQLCDAFDAAFHRIEPGLDIDGDGHSPVESLRGSIWRGR